MKVLDGSLFGADNACFGCAVDHPSGLRLQLHAVEGGVETELLPRTEHQGPPGLMHGGLLMTLADEVGAWAVIAATGRFGFTVEIDGRILRPARVDRPLRARGCATSIGRRVVRTRVDVEQEGEAVLRASLRFVLMDAQGAERLLGRPLPDAWLRFARETTGSDSGD